MLARSLILANLPLVRENCRRRGCLPALRRFLRANARLEAARTGGPAELVDRLAAAERRARRWVPNLSHRCAPVGPDATANRELRRTPLPCHAFVPRRHEELADRLGLVDVAAGEKVAGPGFPMLRNAGVLLDLALQHYAVRILQQEGFDLVGPPDVARRGVLRGAGFRTAGDGVQVYRLAGTDLSLAATAEIALAGLFAGTRLDAATLPRLVCGVSHCFRTEPGRSGGEFRGLFRTHQFTKVEMFAVTAPDQSDAVLDRVRDLQGRLFAGLGIPYRVVDVATGALDGPACRKFDLEAWFPGQPGWGEVTSASSCGDYQARRLGIGVRTRRGAVLAHTVNGTGLAVGRTLAALLETHQQADGSVVLPAALRPLVGTDRLLPRHP